jgi:HSP20 family protein
MRLIRTHGNVALNPFAELDRFFNGVTRAAQAPSFTPSAELFETPEAIEVRVDLPGFSQESIGVQLENGVLTLTAERKEPVQEGAVYYLAERRFGGFERSFKVSPSVDAEKVLARYVDGVLSVTLPKRAETKARKINITNS